MTIVCSACGKIDGHEPHCAFTNQAKSFAARDGRVTAVTSVTPLASQVGGDHYKKMKIQPVEFIHANGIPFIEGCIIKYAARWRDKGGVKDLEKIKHFTDLLIELESRK